MIEAILQEIGLTQNETKVYLALLELGESKTGDILKKSKLNSGKIYEILDSLEQKGLVSAVLKNKVKHFTPADPSRVLEYLEEKKKTIERQEKDVNKILPDLMRKINQVKGKVNIEVFTGYDGLKTAYAKELRYKKGESLYVLGITSSSRYDKKTWTFFTKYHQYKRQQKYYKTKKLIDINSDHKQDEHEKHAEIRYLPFGSAMSINIIKDLTTIGIFSEQPIIISIESEEVAKTMIQHFNLLWKISKK